MNRLSTDHERFYSLPNAAQINDEPLTFPTNPGYANLTALFPSLKLFHPDCATTRPFSTRFVYPPLADNPPTPLQLRIQGVTESCLFKGGLSFVGGGALGLAFGLFASGYTNAVDKAVDMQGSTLVKLRVGMREAWIAMASYAKNFARFGFAFSVTECVIERVRARNDIINATAAGCVTGAGMALSPFQAMPLRARVMQMAMGSASIGLFSMAIEYYMKYMD